MRGSLARDWELRLAALAVAATLWVFVVSGDKSQVALGAAIEYVGLQDGLILVGSQPETVEVQLQATRWTMTRVNADSVRLRVSLANLKAGDNVVPLSSGQVQAPAGVTVTRITPTRLHVTLAGAATRTVPVVPQIRGAPAPDHAMRRVVVDPPTVQVKGPRSTIERGVNVETMPVDVSGSREAVSQTVGLVLPDSVYLTGERTVRVTVDIRREDTMRDAKGAAK